jgi:hypothetical protein
MRTNKERQSVLSFKVTWEMRGIVERLSASLTLKSKRRWTLTDVVEEAIKVLAKREKLK